MAIDRFRGAYHCFSNFFIEPDGTHIEAEFQAAKTHDEQERAFVLRLTPSQSKKAGGKRGLKLPDGTTFRVTLRKDWEDVKEEVMLGLLRRKFGTHEKLREILLGTGDEHIEEGNQHGDKVWGTVNGVGENKLGKALMRVRAELRGDIETEPLPDAIIPLPEMMARKRSDLW